jgi:parallel beta-helix repeat protein
MTPAAPRYLSAESSDQGFVRDNNEDRVYSDDVRGFFLVVDGMGGHEAGEQAAAIAVERIRVRLERQTGTVEQRIREAIALANNAIFEAAKSKPEWNGMACVLTAALIEDGQVTIGHVGDSRLYRLKRGAIEKVTHDHSPVGEREDSGEITEAEAMNHPRRNEVYRDVGSEEHTPDDADFIELLRIPFDPDGALLLCSDGLSDAIASKQILSIIAEHAGDRWATVRSLIAAATEVGKDNVSVVFVEGEKFAASFGKRPARQPKSKPKQAIVTDPPQVRTIIHTPHVPWYARGPAWLVYGLILGALLMFAGLKYFTPKPPPPGPQAIFVKEPDTIAGALAKARPGDTVYIMEGTYTEPVLLKDGVDLIAQPAHAAVIRGSLTAINIQRARFEGFQVRAGGDFGVRISDSNVTVARDEISGAHGPGIEFTGKSTGAIDACWVHDNAGPGIVIRNSAAPDIENNLIISNGAQPKSLRPGLLIESAVRPRVTANVFLANGAEPIWLPQADEVMIGRNYFNVSGKPDKAPKFRVIRPAEATR